MIQSPPLQLPTDWLVLSDLGLASQSDEALLETGIFVAEMMLPLPPATVLINFQAEEGWARTFALFHDLSLGLVLLQRQGNRVVRHVLPGPLPQGRGPARFIFRYDAPRGRSAMSLECLAPQEEGTPSRVRAQGAAPLPLWSADIAALAQGRTQDCGKHPSVLWFGLTRAASLPRQAAWLGLATPVETLRGTVAAGQLRAGDRLVTPTGEPVRLAGVRRLHLPSRGSFTPILMRAPYFGLRRDILISSDMPILLTGPEVEYIFSEEGVMIPASHLVDGRRCVLDDRRATVASVALVLDRPAIILADDCQLFCGPPDARAGDLPYRMLQRHEALTLLPLLGRAPGLPQV